MLSYWPIRAVCLCLQKSECQRKHVAAFSSKFELKWLKLKSGRLICVERSLFVSLQEMEWVSNNFQWAWSMTKYSWKHHKKTKILSMYCKPSKIAARHQHFGRFEELFFFNNLPMHAPFHPAISGFQFSRIFGKETPPYQNGTATKLYGIDGVHVVEFGAVFPLHTGGWISSEKFDFCLVWPVYFSWRWWEKTSTI